MKRIISLVLAVALIVSLAITVFAVQPETVEPQSCNHVWGHEDESVVWSVYSSSQCQRTVVYTKVCKTCAEVSQRSTSTYLIHEDTINDASCDGTTQTHIYTCKNCGAYRYKKWVDCPGANRSHASGCMWLPV